MLLHGRYTLWATRHRTLRHRRLRPRGGARTPCNRSICWS